MRERENRSSLWDAKPPKSLATRANGRQDATTSPTFLFLCVTYAMHIRVYNHPYVRKEERNRTKETNRDEATRCGLMRLPRMWPNASATRSQCCNVPRAIFRFSNLLVAPSVYCFSLPFSLLFTPLLSSLVIAFYVMFL